VTAGLALLATVVIACGGAAPTPNAAASPSPSPLASLGATIAPSPSVAGRDAPPDAALAAEGGDSITGQLGTYVWLETGSDSPWLPGTPLTVGAGEPLVVTVTPDGGIDSWMARYVPVDAPGPAGAITLGQGTENPAFPAPGPGSWTVEVFLEFAAGAGQASYFWRVEVE
jgi:hypothetical protein